MKTGGTSGKKNFVFTFHSVCTVFVPFKMGHFQSSLTVRDLHNYKEVPYGGHGAVNQELRSRDLNGYSLSNQLYFIQIKEGLGM